MRHPFQIRVSLFRQSRSLVVSQYKKDIIGGPEAFSYQLNTLKNFFPVGPVIGFHGIDDIRKKPFFIFGRSGPHSDSLKVAVDVFVGIEPVAQVNPRRKQLFKQTHENYLLFQYAEFPVFAVRLDFFSFISPYGASCIFICQFEDFGIMNDQYNNIFQMFILIAPDRCCQLLEKFPGFFIVPVPHQPVKAEV
jgi:hypothetical protein